MNRNTKQAKVKPAPTSEEYEHQIDQMVYKLWKWGQVLQYNKKGDILLTWQVGPWGDRVR